MLCTVPSYSELYSRSCIFARQTTCSRLSIPQKVLKSATANLRHLSWCWNRWDEVAKHSMLSKRHLGHLNNTKKWQYRRKAFSNSKCTADSGLCEEDERVG